VRFDPVAGRSQRQVHALGGARQAFEFGDKDKQAQVGRIGQHIQNSLSNAAILPVRAIFIEIAPPLQKKQIVARGPLEHTDDF
jgi:hypothetical protein